MQVRKKFFLVCLRMLFLFATTASALTNNPIAPLTYDAEVLALNESSVFPMSTNQISKLELTENSYTGLMTSFYSALSDKEKNRSDVYTVNGIPAEGFPEYYAGAYVNKNLNLVVLLAEDYIATDAKLRSSQQEISSATSSESLVYTSATFSYSNLVGVMNDIFQYTKTSIGAEENQLSTHPFCIEYYAIDDYNNRVIVGLNNTSEATIQSFKNLVTDSPAIKFVACESMDSTLDISVNPGSGLDIGSAAFRVNKYENNAYTYGFIASGHCYNLGDEVKVGSTVVADVVDWQCSGNIDAVFCALRSNHTAGTTIFYIGGTLRDGIDVNLAQGNPLRMIGAKTQGGAGSTGTVELSSYSYQSTTHNTYFYDLMASNYERAGGDSGGIVISTRTGYNWIAGVHRGQHGEFSIFTKAQNITNGFGLTFNDGSEEY